jgi:hypothetical protein
MGSGAIFLDWLRAKARKGRNNARLLMYSILFQHPERLCDG